MPKDLLARASASIEFVDDQGKTLLLDSRKALGLKELSIVVVKGRVQIDNHGNFAIIGKSLFVRADAAPGKEKEDEKPESPGKDKP